MRRTKLTPPGDPASQQLKPEVLSDRMPTPRRRRPTEFKLQRLPWTNDRSGTSFLSRYALVFLGLILIIVFSLALPSTFPTSRTVDSILSDQSTIAMLALGQMLVISVGQYDLSVGYAVGLLELLTVGLLFKSGIAWPIVIVIVLAAGALIGLINGLLVTVARIDSFIATLGLGYFLFGIDNWYSQGQQVIGTSSRPASPT